MTARRFPPPWSAGQSPSTRRRCSSHISSAMLVRLYTSLVFAMGLHRIVGTREAKMTSKQVTLVVGAVLFTAINLLVLAANWSITAHAKVAGMFQILSF